MRRQEKVQEGLRRDGVTLAENRDLSTVSLLVLSQG